MPLNGPPTISTILSFSSSVTTDFLTKYFSISFYGTGVNWITLSFGDLTVKIIVALTMLVPFRLLLYRIQEISSINNKISV